MGRHAQGCCCWTRTLTRMVGAIILLVLHLTGSQGNNIQDPDVVFIGPGYGSDGLSEVLLLPSLTPGACTPPPFPYGEYNSYVGRLSPDGPLLCGGSLSYVEQSSCYLLGQDGSWVTSSSQMTVERQWPAAVELGETWWVTGGADASPNHELSSTEVLTDNTWHISTPLPTNLYGHCIVKINSSHVFIAGGEDDNTYYAASYIYSSTSGTFSRLPDMAITKSDHACGILGTDIWVGGGLHGNAIKSVEVFSLTSQAWRDGPPIPIAPSGGRMMTVDGSLLMFGNRVIWQLKTSGGQDYWGQVGEMETERSLGGFDILRMKLSDCMAWDMHMQ